MEIERKWLVRTDRIPFDLTNCDKIHIKQSYISFRPTIRIRDIDSGRKYILTVKTIAAGFNSDLAKNEYETEITGGEYCELMKLARGNVIRKTRYVCTGRDGLKYEIDIFEGRFSGLAYLEIEFADQAAAVAFPDPDWVECDVTYRPEYKNSALAKYGMPAS